MRKLATAVVLAAGLAGQASAQSSAPMVGAHAPESVVSALRNAGYRAELDTDGNGDPMITSTFASMVSFIYFYGCNEGKDCTSLMFHRLRQRKTVEAGGRAGDQPARPLRLHLAR